MNSMSLVKLTGNAGLIAIVHVADSGAGIGSLAVSLCLAVYRLA
ncbi:hypothetical protein ACFQ44_09760 [Levilactobacillus lanxiensis]|uniref:Uncharacterized protein n=1 Tax=Levilactobacillus lanxiensis TaxID=2799568 RepID=A0ABW4D2Z4_9LACO|nr:hypothetical protein [Levilactobacillus lanxiensis]